MKKEEAFIEPKYRWIFYAKSYLVLARIGIEELKKEHYNSETQYGTYWAYRCCLLLIPSIWNLKHGIELIVKSLCVSAGKGYLQSHDLKELRKELEDGLEGIKNKKYISDLANIIDKYYKCQFWEGKLIGGRQVFDKKNDIFRYPENVSTFPIDLKTFQNVTDEEIQELLDDMELLNRRLEVIGVQIQTGY